MIRMNEEVNVMAEPMTVAVLEAPVASKPSTRMTYDEFLAWAEEDTRAEWVNGEVVFTGQVSKLHQEVGAFLFPLIKLFVEFYQLGIVFYESFQMKTGAGMPGRLPDIHFVAKENFSRIKENYVEGPADLVIEIISTESRSRDRGDKFYEYEQGGVREYWLLDPLRKQAEFYQLGEDGIFRLISPDNEGKYHSTTLPGLWIDVNWLWQSPLPTSLSVLKEWKLF
jgi:Uma2 family endonuclease